MANWIGDLIADVTLLSTAEGGRKGPTPASEFGCMCEVAGALHDCRMDLSDAGPIAPGQTARVPLKFLAPDVALPKLPLGTTFRLREMRTIGHGTVVQLGPLV